MADTNYIASVVKLLENPRQKMSWNMIPFTECRVQLPQSQETKIIKLVVWGKLGQTFAKNYRLYDYIIIEGYLSPRYIYKNFRKLTTKKFEIAVFRIYPFLLWYDPNMGR